LSIRPVHGSSWAPRKRPARLPATYHRTHGIRYFHGCYSLGDDQLWGVLHERKGADHTLAGLKSIRVLAATLFEYESAAFGVHVPAAGSWPGRLRARRGSPRRLASAAMASSSRALTRACWSAARRARNSAIARRCSAWAASWRTRAATAGLTGGAAGRAGGMVSPG